MRPALRFLILAAGLALAASAKAQTTLTVTPGFASAGGSVTAAWSGVPSPLWSDWIGLFTPSAQDWSYSAWSYTSGTASGSIPFSIPSNTALGTYQLRLFSGGVKRATSNNFTVSRTVGGTVTLGGSPLAGVAFTATNGGVCTTSNASGVYLCAVANGWSGTVTPTPTSYTFTPTSRSYSNVTTNQTAQNYTAVPFRQVSGTVTFNGLPLANVAFSTGGTGSCTTSNASGQYSCSVPDGWTGSVTPSQTGYAFTPSSKSYTAISADDPGEDYTASLSSPTSNISFIHVDHLNTPRVVANSSGTTVWRWDQAEPFGVNVANEDPDGNSVNFEFPLRFPGQYLDKETNLHYNYFRDYDSVIGRYVRSDPIGLMGGLNTYSYVDARPTSLMDDLGLWSTKAHNKIIEAAFPGLSPDLIKAIKDGSRYADNFQNAGSSHVHAMRSSPAQSEQECRRKLCDWYKRYYDQYDRDKDSPDPKKRRRAYWNLGMATHPAMDSTSVVHDNCRIVWDFDDAGFHGEDPSLEGLSALTSDMLRKTMELVRRASRGGYCQMCY